MLRPATHMSVPNVTDTSFRSEVLESQQPVLVDFCAVWAGSCRSLAPHLYNVAQELEGQLRVVKLNIDENHRTPLAYQIRSLPTLLLFKNGQVVDQMTGNPGSKAKLAEFVGRHV